MGRGVEKILGRIHITRPRRGSTVRGAKIATAKKQGLVRQRGRHLALTPKGRKAAAKIGR